jgi:hypothetical protein
MAIHKKSDWSKETCTLGVLGGRLEIKKIGGNETKQC